MKLALHRRLALPKFSLNVSWIETARNSPFGPGSRGGGGWTLFVPSESSRIPRTDLIPSPVHLFPRPMFPLQPWHVKRIPMTLFFWVFFVCVVPFHSVHSPMRWCIFGMQFSSWDLWPQKGLFMGTSLFSSSPFFQIIRNLHMASGKRLGQVSVVKQTLSSASDPKGIGRVNSGLLSGY